MSSRTELHSELYNILGTNNVYFQPPESVSMKYPAIVYAVESIDNSFSNNVVYLQKFTYRVIVIDKSPESDIVKKLSKLPKCKYVNHYASDNLYHDVFKIIKEEIV